LLKRFQAVFHRWGGTYELELRLGALHQALKAPAHHGRRNEKDNHTIRSSARHDDSQSVGQVMNSMAGLPGVQKRIALSPFIAEPSHIKTQKFVGLPPTRM
jgi:hypothetical protein